jgi:hypothetical protein
MNAGLGWLIVSLRARRLLARERKTIVLVLCLVFVVRRVTRSESRKPVPEACPPIAFQ